MKAAVHPTPFRSPFLSKMAAETAKRAKKRKEQQEKDEAKIPAIPIVIHKPTYCVLIHHNINDEPIKHDRHMLSNFRVKLDGEMSKQAKSRFSTALNWLFLFADKKNVYCKEGWIDKDGKERHNFSFRLAMITLTLSDAQFHSDAEIKEKLLQPFLNWLTRSHRASFVWKAETQLNGNIHFHINVDKFIPWKSVRSKWNTLLAAQGYCKIFNDGSNDKGNAATDISAIKNEKGLAAVVGGYLTKGSIEEKYHDELKKKKVTIEELIEKGNYISCDVNTRKHYTRLVEGRIWGQSESISNVDVRISAVDEGWERFGISEREFFRGNDLKRLSDVMLQEAKKKFVNYSELDKCKFGFDDVTLKKQFSRYANVYIHRNLKFCKLPDILQVRIQEEKLNRQFHGQKYFTVDSLN